MNIDFLKQDFLEDAKSVFGSDYEAFLETYNEKPYRGISVNTLKITAERLKELLVYKLEKTPMYKNGYYIDSEIEGLGNNLLTNWVSKIDKDYTYSKSVNTDVYSMITFN